jgi:hypothetical protein
VKAKAKTPSENASKRPLFTEPGCKAIARIPP